MSRNKGRSNSSQLPIVFPPRASEENRRIWERCKLLYPTRIIVLVEPPFGFSLDSDALALQALDDCGIMADNTGACYFLYSNIGSILKKAELIDLDVVICNPPEDVACHLFN